jgi:hypothetical protein
MSDSAIMHQMTPTGRETEYVDRFGHRFWIPVYGPVCENAAPRFGSSEAIDDHAMEQCPIEGQIYRLKAIKRQMYGRAGFEQLKVRVLPWNASSAA